ncbi:hypothetical protein [Microtetraspora sp. NBRC 16547]|uniref:hypothetical protein n=1 Tax=Microtetraspora sp. NBRC 16547 TaxID=3030993 RepID=UPI0024A354FC|nr:hypothetical protein [Microtetraspora sp. NBRC 16547]GLW99569.1 hypothetical protein Misp02_36560 [Microtetraspora sp. NBRC 16547]
MTRKLAILAAAVAATTSALAIPTMAEAKTGAASAANAQIRYVWVKSCGEKDYTVPCGSWNFVTRDGKTRTLGDARVYAVNARGKVDKESLAALAISDDGEKVAYFRKSDNKLVIRDLATNRVRALPGTASRLPKGLGMSDLVTTLSPDGSSLLIDYQDENDKLPSLLVNMATGKIAKLRTDLYLQGFSPDSRHVLASRYTRENTTELRVLDENGATTGRKVVPQVIANNTPQALANDGNTVAVMINMTGGKQRLRVYDLESDSVGDAVNVNVPKNETPQQLRWDDSGNLTVWEMRSDKDGNTNGLVRRTLDPTSGGTTKTDSFPLTAKVYMWWVPGE